MDLCKALDLLTEEKDELLERVENNEALLKKLFIKFTKDTAITEIENALADNDMKQLENAAHKLKGLSGNLGFTRLKEMCASLVDDLKAGIIENTETLCMGIRNEYNRIVEVICQLDEEKP